MSKEKEMHKTGWANIELPLHLKKAREEQERLNQEKKDEDAAEKDLKFMTGGKFKYKGNTAPPALRTPKIPTSICTDHGMHIATTLSGLTPSSVR